MGETGKKLAIALLLPALCLTGCSSMTEKTEISAGEKQETETVLQGPYDRDVRLELVETKAWAYDGEVSPAESFLGDQYRWITKGYDEEEIAESTHAAFDEKNRMLYALGYTSAILEDRISYCEEQVYEWDDINHTCRHIYYKSNSRLCDWGYYVALRYMFDVCYYQFTEDGRLLSRLDYSRDVGSDPFGYSEELYFNRGYQAEYDGELLKEELLCYNFWGSNEFGSWEYRAYQYNDQGDCTAKVAVTEEETLLFCYEYDEASKKTDEYTYRIREDWEMAREDGSVLRFHVGWDAPAVEKLSPDGTVEKTLFYGKVTDMGQEPYLMPQDVEETVEDHKYVVKPGDSLWKIAYECYGQGSQYELLYQVNRELIGPDANLILPGTRLYIPETGSERDTKRK